MTSNQETTSLSMTTNGASAEQKRAVVCVFCGASPGNSEAHMQAARDIAKLLFENNCNLVYGGGTSGLMGEVARTFVALSGSPDRVHGIIPKALQEFEQDAKPIDESIYGRMTIVKDMHTRKKMMAKEVQEGGVGSGFIALSGGYGTLEELAEMTTWNQLGLMDKPVVAYNIDGYWDGLFSWLKGAVDSGFIRDENMNILMEGKSADQVFWWLKNFKVSGARLKLNWESEG